MPQFSFGQIYSAKSILGVLACAGLFLISSPKAISQTFYGSIVGTVSDSTGAIIPGASVTLTNLGTSDKRTMVSTDSGSYRFVIWCRASIGSRWSRAASSASRESRWLSRWKAR